MSRPASLTSVLLLTLFSAILGAEPVWKRSDALGNDLGDAPQRAAGSGWVLKVDTTANGEERSLFHDGALDSLRLVDLDPAGRVTRSRDVRSGQPVWEVDYDPVAGLPTKETVFENGRPVQTSLLEFGGRTLVRRSVLDAEGTPVFSDRLLHWPDGSLRRLERDGPSGPLAEVSWSYGPRGELVRVWSADEDEHGKGQHREVAFEPSKTVETLAQEAKVLLSRVTEALEAGTRETRTDPTADRTEVRTYDERGRILQELIQSKGSVLQTRTWVYDDRGRIHTLTTDSAGPQEVWTYVYGEDGTDGTLTRDGVIVKDERLVDGERQRVRWYDRGSLFLEETWKAGKRVKETYYRSGQVVRERAP